MKRTALQGFLILMLCILAPVNTAMAQISIAQTGTWSETINSADLQAGAGSEFTSDYESATNVTSIDITGTTGDSDNWRVDIKKVDSTWNGSLHIYGKRTTDGSGTGSISGGGTYQEISDSYLSFFSGSGDRTSVTIQFKLSGVSTQVPPDNFSVTVYYTVVDN